MVISIVVSVLILNTLRIADRMLWSVVMGHNEGVPPPKYIDCNCCFFFFRFCFCFCCCVDVVVDTTLDDGADADIVAVRCIISISLIIAFVYS